MSLSSVHWAYYLLSGGSRHFLVLTSRPNTELADDILALYDPPAVYISDEGAAFAPCNATVPSLGVEIGGKVFWISEADMLMQDVVDEETGYCLTGPQDGGEGPYILGDTFMNNVISVFDIGASEMRFAAHEY